MVSDKNLNSIINIFSRRLSTPQMHTTQIRILPGQTDINPDQGKDTTPFIKGTLKNVLEPSHSSLFQAFS